MMRVFVFRFVIVLLVIGFLPYVVSAYGAGIKIAAVVGDDVISTVDLDERLHLAIMSSGMEPLPEMKQRLLPQVLKILIDERLYAQEAERLGISVSQMDVNEGVMNLEKRNGVKAGGFDEFLADKGVPYSVVIDQLKAQIMWNRIVSRKVRPQVIVTEKELDEKIEHISHSRGMAELHLSEIVLPIPSVDDKKAVELFARGLVDQMRNEEVDFASIAREFSRSVSAVDGGDIGWLREDQVSSDVVTKVRSLQEGEVSDPFVTLEGMYIVRLNERRAVVEDYAVDSAIGIMQAIVSVGQGATSDVVVHKREEINKAAENVGACDEFADFAHKIGSVVSPNLIETNLAALNAEIRGAVSPTPVGSISPVIRGPGGLYVYMVCSKDEPKTSVVVRDKVRELLLRKKVELRSQRYLRRLRDKTYIEIRI